MVLCPLPWPVLCVLSIPVRSTMSSPGAITARPSLPTTVTARPTYRNWGTTARRRKSTYCVIVFCPTTSCCWKLPRGICLSLCNRCRPVSPSLLIGGIGIPGTSSSNAIRRGAQGQVLHYKSSRRLDWVECAKPNTVLDRLLRVSGIAVFVPHRFLAQERRARLDI
jgi:hypothetical protein